jgi:rubrerythrin
MKIKMTRAEKKQLRNIYCKSQMMSGEATILNLGDSRSKDAHCYACGFTMLRGATIPECPKCGSDRWYKTHIK